MGLEHGVCRTYVVRAAEPLRRSARISSGKAKRAKVVDDEREQLCKLYGEIRNNLKDIRNRGDVPIPVWAGRFESVEVRKRRHCIAAARVCMRACVCMACVLR